MSRSRRALLAKALEAKRRQRPAFTPVPSWAWPLQPEVMARLSPEFIAAQERYLAEECRLKRRIPRPTGVVARTLEARAAVAAAAASPGVTRTRLAKCAGCGSRQEVPGGDTPAVCPACGRGGL